MAVFKGLYVESQRSNHVGFIICILLVFKIITITLLIYNYIASTLHEFYVKEFTLQAFLYKTCGIELIYYYMLNE